MKSYSYAVLLFTLSLCASPAIGSDAPVRQGRGIINTVFMPVTFLLDTICRPLHYFSTSDQSQKNFDAAVQMMSLPDLDEEKLKEAYGLLELSAVEGNPHALHNIGLLMLGMPAITFQGLGKFIGIRENEAKQYLEAADRAGIPFTDELKQDIQYMKYLNQALDLAYDNPPNFRKAKVLVNFAARKKSPHASLFLAEVILKSAEGDYDWLGIKHKTLYERRKHAIPLLECAASRMIPNARSLMAELEMEDRVYEIICEMILKDAEKTINDLKLGESGFQESYIDDLCQRQIQINGYVLNPERCFFLKTVMNKRVSQLFHYLSDYSRYVLENNSLAGKYPAELTYMDLNNSLNRMVEGVIGKTKISVPLLKGQSENTQIHYDFLSRGLTCAVTRLDATTAYRKIINVDDDFNDSK